jgi:hypothetical protein
MVSLRTSIVINHGVIKGREAPKSSNTLAGV